MASSPFRRDNHYVPRAYLKRWEHAPGRIWTYRVLVSHEAVPLWKPASTRGVAYHEHLYTQIAASGESDELERWLDAEFESPAEEAVEKATTDRRLTSADWRRLARFFAAQDVRTPARLVENLERWNHELPGLIENSIQDSVRRLGEADEAERNQLAQVAPASDPIPFRVSVEMREKGQGGYVKGETVAGRGLWVWSIRHLLTDTLKVLEQHRWTILAPPEGMNWFTSDDPVLKVNFNSLSAYTFAGGWGSRGTDLLLPLGPQHLLFTQVGRPVPPRGTRMTPEKAHIVRRLIAEHAHRFVFAAERDPFVAEVRPRTVNAELLRSEAKEWERWHAEQTAAERELMGWGEAPSSTG